MTEHNRPQSKFTTVDPSLPESATLPGQLAALERLFRLALMVRPSNKPGLAPASTPTCKLPIPILIPVNRGALANPGFFPDPGQIGIPRFPGIPAKSGSGQNPEYIPDPGPIGIGKIPAIFPAKSGRGGAGFGDLGVCVQLPQVHGADYTAHNAPDPTLGIRPPGPGRHPRGSPPAARGPPSAPGPGPGPRGCARGGFKFPQVFGRAPGAWAVFRVFMGRRPDSQGRRS